MTDEPRSWHSIAVPLHTFIGLEVDRVGSPSRVTIPLSDAARGGVAPLHGGVVATLIDVACGAAIGASYDQTTEVPVSTEIHVRYYRQPKSSPIVAQAEVVHRGSKIIGVECVVTDGDGRQIARGTGSYMIVSGFAELAQGPPKNLSPYSGEVAT